jgi:hypothetical protein
MTRRDWTFLGRSLVPLLLGVLALALTLPAGAGAVEPGTGTITGTVTLEASGGAVGIEVCAYPVVEIGLEEEEECESTGAGGHYEITGLRATEYKVFFWPQEESAYVYQYYDHAISWEAADPVLVTAGGVASNIDATLEKGATISGTVTAAATGLPVAEVEVCAESYEGFGRCAETAPSGRYTIEGLASGDYYVYFYPEESGLDVIGQSYPGRSFSEEPAAFFVAPKQNVTGINAALSAGGQILGTVRSAANGSPLAGVEVCLTEASRLRPAACLTTRGSGAYEFEGVWTADWKVVFSPSLADLYGAEVVPIIEDEESPPELAPWNDSYPTQWWSGQTSFATATPIALTAPATVEGIDATLGTPPALTQPGPSPAATTTTPAPTVSKVAKAKPKKQKAKGPLRCKRGFSKRKMHGRVRCVRSHKVVPHSNSKKKHRKHRA